MQRFISASVIVAYLIAAASTSVDAFWRGGVVEYGVTYVGPCDVSGVICAEAWNPDYAATYQYSGPLLQIALVANDDTLDIQQTDDHKADMTTWSAFCGGVASNCYVSKIYAQIHGHVNDLVHFTAANGCDDPSKHYRCAYPFAISAITGLPELKAYLNVWPTTSGYAEYTIGGTSDNNATGLGTAFSSRPISIVYVGVPYTATTYCCGTFGETHPYNVGYTSGQDYMTIPDAYGWANSGGSGPNVNCATATVYCDGDEEESANTIVTDSSGPRDNIISISTFDPTNGPHGTTCGYINGTELFCMTPISWTNDSDNLAPGNNVHLGGGGDLSQPDYTDVFELLITNTALTPSAVSALTSNIENRYPGLTFN
jgi:hypothetical protein